MRLVIALVALTVVACQSRDRAADSTVVAGGDTPPACVEGVGAPTLTAAGVGPVRLGASMSEISQRCTVRDSSFTLGEGIMERGRVIDLGMATVVVLVTEDAEPTVSRVIVNDPAIRTEAGVGVGRDVASMRAAYGTLCAAMGEGRVVLMAPPLPGVSFGISQRPSSLPRGGAGIDRTPEAIPDSSTITSIWVHGASTNCGGS